MEKLLLLDGHSILNRAFYGVPDFTNSEGKHTGAIFGFLNIMLKVLEDENPQYFAVAFDTHAPTFRHEIYAEYKGTRKPMAEELREQVPLMKDLLAAMDVPVIAEAGLEADDLIGTTAVKWEKKGFLVTIVSGDRDLLQLVTDHIKLLFPRTAKGVTTVTPYFAEDVLKEYQLPPSGIIELKALMGDSSDNIPGVPKIGPKTATELLLQYGNIQTLKEHIGEIKRKAVRETLEAHFDMAELSKTLATIETNADIELSPEEARLTNLFTSDAYEIIRELELKTFYKKFEAAGETRQESLEDSFPTVTDPGQAAEKLKELDPAAPAGFAADLTEGRLRGLAFQAGETAFYLSAEGELSEETLLSMLKEFIDGREGVLYTVNLKNLLKTADLPDRGHLIDVEIELYLLDPLRNGYDIPGDAREGARKAFTEGPLLLNRIREEGMEDLLMNVEMPLIRVLSEMEKEGIRVLPEELRRFSEELGNSMEALEAGIYEGAGEKFNINSPKQLGVILFEKLKLKGGKKTKTGYSTSAEILEKLAPEVPFVRQVLDYRQLSKLKATYADGLTAFIGEEDRIHSTFNQTITATGRISSADPNLQNIPVRTELGREFRKIFIPREGYCFIDADYSQIELRILASLSGDEKLIAAYQEGKDIHAITASQVFHVPFEEVTEDLRRNAKAVNFGIVYGISSFGLSQGLSITRAEAKDYIDRYFETYPGVKAYLDGLVSSAKEKGYAETYFHRKRPVPELKNSNFAQRSFGERVAMNAPIQGTAADIIKIAMVRVSRALKDRGLQSRLILQVHDELLVETKLGEEAAVTEILMKEMPGAADLAVPLIAEVKTGMSWYEAH